jgi:hypothetical protein
VQRAHAVAGGAEHQRGRRLEEAQHVDHRLRPLAMADAHGAVFDVGVRLIAHQRIDAQRIALVLAGEAGDLAGNGGGKQQRAAGRGGGGQQLVEFVAEPQVEHLVGLVQHHHAQRRQIQPQPRQVVAQPPRRADDDVAAGGEGPRLHPAIHAADARDDARAGVLIQPRQFAMHLHGQFAGRRDHQRQRRAGAREPGFGAEQRGGEGQSVGDRLARAGLRRHQQVARLGTLQQHGFLNRRRLGVAARGERAPEGGIGRRERHAEFHDRQGRHAGWRGGQDRRRAG